MPRGLIFLPLVALIAGVSAAGIHQRPSAAMARMASRAAEEEESRQMKFTLTVPVSFIRSAFMRAKSRSAAARSGSSVAKVSGYS
jgi:hypothetical protein